MGAKLQSFGRGGQGGEQLSATRRKLAQKAAGDLDEAYRTLLELMRTARRETVRFDAAITVIELAEGAELEDADVPERGRVVVLGRSELTTALKELRDKGAA